MSKILKVVAVVVVLFIVIGVLASSGEAEPTNSAQASETERKEDNVPQEYKSALSKANTYAKTMQMSKASVYDQLVSEYGEKFSEEAAQYAMERVEADWKENALNKAKTYQKDMNMSPAAIRDQLVSLHGEKFTEDEADYAMENLDA